jgi:phosphoribosylanthranilate isomerase
MIVKVCGITNREDALAAVEAGASAIGFNFYRESPRYISPTGAAMIAEKIPANVWKVGVFVHEGPESIARIVLDAGLDVVQLHGTAQARGIRIWRGYQADESLLDQVVTQEQPEALLIDTPSKELYGGTGETFDWTLAKDLQIRAIIAGGLDADNVQQAIEQAQPWGVDACSRIERAPGLKDHEKMRRFIHAALHS